MRISSARSGATVLVAASLLAAAVQGPAHSAAARSDARAECPRELSCRFVPAAHGRFTAADRERDGLDLRYIVIHTTDLSHRETLDLVRNPEGSTSAHYLVRSRDGAVTQFVANKDVANHAGNNWFNMHSIGIEHEGILADGDGWYTDAMYQSSAALVRHLAKRHGIPLDREHILGHDEVAPPAPEQVIGMASDPGPFWDWARFFDLLGAPLSGPSPGAPSSVLPRPSVVAIAPRFEGNRIPLFYCHTETCTEPASQGSSAVYLHTEPRPDAPLISDTVLHPEGQPGTAVLQDWSSRALTGQRFAVAGRYDGWTAIWFGGRVGWFLDPQGNVGAPDHGTLVTSRRAEIPVYGAAYPEASAYPAKLTPTAVEPLQYTIAAGQFYVVVAEHSGDDYLAPRDAPNSRIHVIGTRRMVEISFNHRRAFVNLDDVLTLN